MERGWCVYCRTYTPRNPVTSVRATGLDGRPVYFDPEKAVDYPTGVKARFFSWRHAGFPDEDFILHAAKS
jgi:hypothetical protein